MAHNPTHILQALDALNELDNRLTDSIRAITRLSDQYATTAQSLTQLLIGTLPPDAARTMRTTITSFRSESTRQPRTRRLLLHHPRSCPYAARRYKHPDLTRCDSAGSLMYAVANNSAEICDN